MMGRLTKWFHRRVLDAVLHDPPPVVAIVVFALSSVFFLGYLAAQYKDEIVLPGYGLHGVFADNIAGRSFFDKLGTGILPVDVVYTWVNGSDPILVSGLRSLLRTISGQCSPPHYCAQARYVATPLRSSANISHLTSIIQATPRLAGALSVTAQTGAKGSYSKLFVVARVMSPSVEEEQEIDDGFERPDDVNNRRPPLPRLTRGRTGGRRAAPVGTTTPAMSDVDEVVSDLQRRLSEAGIEVVASQALWSTESNHGWSIPKDTAAFVISDKQLNVDVMYHKVTRSIPEFDQSCDRQVVPNGFFVECIDKLLIDDLREAVILYNTPQTDDLMQARDARVQASLHNNVPVLAAIGRDASGPGLRRRYRGGTVKEATGEGEKRGLGDLEKGSMEMQGNGQLERDDDSQLLPGFIGRDKTLLGNLRKSIKEVAKVDTDDGSKDDFAVGKERNGVVDVNLDSAVQHFVRNDSRRHPMKRKLQSATDDSEDKISLLEADAYVNFMDDLKGRNSDTDEYSDPNNDKGHERLLLDTRDPHVNSQDLIFQNKVKKQRQGYQFNEELIDSNHVLNKFDSLPKNNIRTLMVLGGKFQHKRSKERFDSRSLPNATLGPIDKSDRALAFRIGDNRLDVIKSYVDKDHQDPSLQNDVKLDQSGNNLPSPIDVRKIGSLPQNSPTSRPSLPVRSKLKNMPHGTKPHHSKSGEASKRKLDDLLEPGPMTAKPDKGRLVKKTKMLRDSEEDVLAKGPLQFLPAFLLLQIIENDKLRESVTVNRFQDSEELRYSLRSLERYAGWVRHVYLVTNGQLPHWLNLDHPRLTVVTHETIFPDKSHLPTYSSPAIESHLHRIPGLSRQFLYLNDDVLLGAPVWPHDFHTHDEGQKVYLSWSLPNCASGCAHSWLADGYCDMPCNVSLCNFDGGDCFGDVNMGVGLGPDDDFGGHIDSMYDDYDGAIQCSDGCVSTWLADGYCDSLCNTAACGYDCGDCGLRQVQTLHQLPPPARNTSQHVALPANTVSWWIDLSSLLTLNHTIEGEYFVTRLGQGDSAPYAVPVSGEQERSGHGVLSLTASTQLRLVVAVMQLNFTNGIMLRVKIKHNATGSLDWCNYSITFNAAVKSNPPPIIAFGKEAHEPLQQQEVNRLHFNFTRIVPRDVEDNKLKGLKESLADGIGEADAYHNVDAKASTFEDSVVEKIQRIVDLFLRSDLTVEGLKIKKHLTVEEYLLQNPSKRANLVYLDAGWIYSLLRSSEISTIASNPTSAPIAERDGLVIDGGRKLLWIRNCNNDMKLLNNVNSIKISEEKSILDDFTSSEKKPFLKFRSKSVDVANVTDTGPFDSYRGNLPWEKRQIFGKAALTRDLASGFDWDAIARKMDLKIRYYYEEGSSACWNDTIADALELNKLYVKSSYKHRQSLTSLKDTFYDTLSSLTGEFLTFIKYTRGKRENSHSNKSNSCGIFINSNPDISGGEYFESSMSGLTAYTTEESPDQLLDQSVELMSPGRRRVLDNFADSLLYVNRLYNEELGIRVRKVPAHTPHFINSTVMEELQHTFSREFAETSSHRVRHSRDMQYAFSYYYFLLGATRQRSLQEVFEEFDTDHSATLSDRELRTLLSRLGPVPVQYSRVQQLHRVLHNCSLHHPVPPVPTPTYERYADSTLPPITLALIERCMDVQNILTPLRKTPRFHVSEQNDAVVHFKMISSNLSKVVTMLDEVRKEPRKFVCLNNNLDPEGSDNSMILALLQDTYEALYPEPSSFELPPNFRNRFLYVHELEEWRMWRDAVRTVVYSCFAVLVFISVSSFWGTSIQNCQRRWCQRRRRQHLEKVVVCPV